MKSEYKVRRTRLATQLTAVALTTVALALVGCGGKKDKAASQTAAKVNKEEITVHQINLVLQQQRGLRPEQADAASKQVLERLIDQQLAVQKAEDLKLDRDPRVVQQLEAAKREIVARAYLERVGEGAAKPTAEEVKKYYDEKPALFKDRRIYSIQELQIEAKPEQIDALRAKLAESQNITAFVDYLKANDFKFVGNQAVRPAEQLPMTSLDALASMKEGQMTLNPVPNGAQVVVLAGMRSQPVTLERATPAIEQFLLNERKRDLITNDLKQLRSLAKVEYIGKFAGEQGGAASQAAAGDAAAAPAPAPAPAPVAAAPAPAPASAASAGQLDASSISKGMGLK